MAGIPGLEPRLTESESAVLPLDDIPLQGVLYISTKKNQVKNSLDNSKIKTSLKC